MVFEQRQTGFPRFCRHHFITGPADQQFADSQHNFVVIDTQDERTSRNGRRGSQWLPRSSEGSIPRFWRKSTIVRPSSITSPLLRKLGLFFEVAKYGQRGLAEANATIIRRNAMIGPDGYCRLAHRTMEVSQQQLVLKDSSRKDDGIELVRRTNSQCNILQAKTDTTLKSASYIGRVLATQPVADDRLQ